MEKIFIFKEKKTKQKKLIRFMKYCLIFIILGIGACFANETYSQRTFFTFEYKNRTVKEIIREIEQSSEYIFFYMDNSVNLNRKVTVRVDNERVEKVLDQLFAGTRNQYYVSDRQIIISSAKSPELVNIAPVIQQQGRTITGVVRDTSGPVIGANVVVKGTTNGDVTNVDGRFSISNIQSNAILQVSFIGYVSQEVTVGNRTQFDIIIQEDIGALEEVVVVGYGTLQRKDVTGSVAQVTANAIQNVAPTRVDQALTGLMAGVQVISATGKPGDAPIVRVRGVGSISAGTGPLYVVDGFPEADIQMLNPNDIETIDILKDASATAIYGSRGANGVIMVTTKRGNDGKATINLDINYGWQQVLKFPEYLTMQEQAQYYYEGIIHQNVDDGADISGDPLNWRYPLPITVKNVLDGVTAESHDPFDHIFRTAPQQNYSISARGGTSNMKYSVSGAYLSQEGIIIMNGYQRYSVRANLDAKLNERVSMKFSINSTYSTLQDILDSGGGAEAEGILGAATTWMYWYPLYKEDGDYLSAYGQDAINGCWNPVAQAYEIKRGEERYRSLINLVTDIKITNDLRLNSMLGATTSNRRYYYFIPKLPALNDLAAEGRDERSNSLNWITETTLNYQKIISGNSINALIGYTTQQNYNNSNFVRSRGYPNNLVYTLNAVSNNVDQGSSEESQWTLISYLARINYNYNSKYYLTASIRADGSSRFGRDNKFGYFPSAVLMWRISEEGFLKEISSINDLRLRASYGLTGNNNIGNYAHLATVTYPSYVLGLTSVGGIAPNNIENSQLTWEKQSSINFGLDLSLFNSRINLSAEYSITNNRDLLLNVDVPRITGFSTSLQNIGEVENKGWEFTLNTHNLKGVVDWKTNFNISAFRNKVLKLGPEGAPLINTNHITEIGQPMGMFYGYQQDGIFKNQAELDAGPIWAPGSPDRSRVGDIRFKDISGPDGVPDGIISTHDRTIIGNPYPKFYYGMTNTVSYQNFILSISLAGSYGNQVFNGNDNQLYTRARYKQYAIVKDYWKSENDPGDGIQPRPNNAPKGGLREKSTRFIDTGSYMKVNNINLSYSFPGRMVQSIYLSGLRVYVIANNPFIFTKFRDFNPEVYHSTDPRTPGQMNYNYPIAKSLLFGVNVSF